MSGHHDQMSRQPGLPLIWCQRLAVGEGLVLGLLGSILLGHFDWSGSLFVLLTPLLLGVLGRLAAVTRQKRPERGGLGIGVRSWFGIWLGVLGWESFQPQTITDCLHVDAPCGPTTVPFWGDWVGLELFIFFLVLGVGLVLVMLSWFITSIVLHFARRSATKFELSRNHA